MPTARKTRGASRSARKPKRETKAGKKPARRSKDDTPLLWAEDVAETRERAAVQKTSKKRGRKSKEQAPSAEAPETTESPTSEPRRKESSPRRVTAQHLAAKQREISVSEFFTKNRHLLGFDNPRKALLTTIKEAVDNSLDACEEAGILPDILVEVRQVAENRYRVVVTDNGPGIVKSQIPKIFGKLLYGSKFHTLKQSRGQQGIGISAAGMYGQITTGQPVVITSKPSRSHPAHYYEIQINTRKNAPEILKEGDNHWEGVATGTRVEIELEAKYLRGRHSVDEYLAQTALANPHATLRYQAPDAEEILYERTSKQLPPDPLEIRPHPYGVELGTLRAMMRETKARNLFSFLQHEFSRVSPRIAREIIERAGLAEKNRPKTVANGHIENLYRSITETKIMAPPTNCIVPIGEELIHRSLASNLNPELVEATTRSPAVYRGNPFLVEAGIAYGGDLPEDGLVNLYRLANRVPLLYQQSACAITQTVIDIDWRSYGLSQSRGALPAGQAAILVHIASAWVPFTSESKEAIADYPEINKEIRLALQECGRKLSLHVRRKRREAESERKRSYIEKYIPHIGIALQEILDLKEKQKEQVIVKLTDVLERSRKA
jgi:DNA topoisomerase-6 subunit B